MEVVKNENVEATQNDAEVTPPVETQPARQESLPETQQSAVPKELSVQTLSIEVSSFEDNRQDIKVSTPNGWSLAENVGTLDIAKAILLKKL